LILNAQIHLFGGLTLSGGTFVAPDGNLLYTTERKVPSPERLQVYRRCYASHNRPNGSARPSRRFQWAADHGRSSPDRSTAGLYRFPRLFCRSRTKGRTQHPFTVLVDQFLDGQLYKWSLLLEEVRSSTNDQGDTVIIVKRVGTVKS